MRHSDGLVDMVVKSMFDGMPPATTVMTTDENSNQAFLEFFLERQQIWLRNHFGMSKDDRPRSPPPRRFTSPWLHPPWLKSNQADAVEASECDDRHNFVRLLKHCTGGHIFKLFKGDVVSVDHSEKIAEDKNRMRYLKFDVLVNCVNAMSKPRNKFVRVWKTTLKQYKKGTENSAVESCNDLIDSNDDILKEAIEKPEADNDKNENKERGNGTELFFKSIVENCKDLSEEELLEFQITVLKCLKNLKARRELKQNLRRLYDASKTLLSI